MTIRLTVPLKQHKHQVIAYKKDFLERGENLAGSASLEEVSNYEVWLDGVIKETSHLTCPKDKVPASLFLAVTDDKNQTVVGMIQLRHHIDHPILSTWGGHIGYSVSPSHRRKGYAKEMLGHCLLEAEKLGINQVLVTCSKDNIGSKKTILANKGVFESSVAHDNTTYERYWITVF